MARVKITGMDDLAEELSRLGNLTDDLASAMLKAGAIPVTETRREEAERRRHRDTGQMIANIKADRKVYERNGVKEMTVYSRGTDSKGVRNAEKEYVLNYGTSKLDGDHWVEAANEKAEPQALGAMETVMDHFVEKGVVPITGSMHK